MNEQNDLNRRFLSMTTEPIPGLITRLAVPTIITMLVTSLYNMADTYFVGKINTSATGAVGIVFSLMTIIQVVGMTLGVGSGSYIARLLGQKNVKRACEATSTAFFLALAIGTGLSLFGEIFINPLMRLLGSTETILPYACAYARYILLGAPFMAASFVMNVNLRSEGSAVLAMFGIASGAIINIVLDPIFIFVFRMGIAGAALATTLSQIIGFLILLSHYSKKRSVLKIRFKYLVLDWTMAKEIMRSGTATFFRQSFVSIAATILNIAAGFYGDAAIAGMSIVNRVMFFIGASLIGLGQGFQPVAAFNYTAGRRDRVYQAFWFTVGLGSAGLLIISSISVGLAASIISLFRNDPDVVAVGTVALRMQSITMPLNAFVVVSNMMFQYIGKPLKATILALSRQGLLFVPTVFILSRLLGLLGIEISQAVADALSFFLAIPLTVGTLKALKSDGNLSSNLEFTKTAKLEGLVEN